MGFTKYHRLQSPIWACRLTPETQQDIVDEMSTSSTSAQLADVTTALNDTNGVLEYTFRYRNTTTPQELKYGNWLVRMPNGRLNVMTDADFAGTYIDKSVDVDIPDEKEMSFRSALLAFVNNNFPDMYLSTQAPAITPFIQLPPESATSSTNVQTSFSGVATVVNPTVTKFGKDLTPVEVVITLAAPKKITKYLVTQLPESYNAPRAWTLTAYNSAEGTSKLIHSVGVQDAKPGFYSPEAFIADKFVLNISEFEYAEEIVNGFMVTFTIGGEIITENPNPTPFSAWTATILEQAAERLSIWYDEGTDRYTVKLPTSAITDMDGLADLLPVLMKAKFIKPTTTIGLTFTNGKLVSGRYPNQIGADALDFLIYQIRNLPKDLRIKIKELDFSSTFADSPSAICKSVTNNTAALWDSFVTEILSITGVEAPLQIKK